MAERHVNSLLVPDDYSQAEVDKQIRKHIAKGEQSNIFFKLMEER